MGQPARPRRAIDLEAPSGGKSFASNPTRAPYRSDRRDDYAQMNQRISTSCADRVDLDGDGSPFVVDGGGLFLAFAERRWLGRKARFDVRGDEQVERRHHNEREKCRGDEAT